jgi:hypothetical protein
MPIVNARAPWIVIGVVGLLGWLQQPGASQQRGSLKEEPPPVSVDGAGLLQLHFYDQRSTAAALTIQLDSGGHGGGVIDQLFVINSATPLPLKELATRGSVSYRKSKEHHSLTLTTADRGKWQFVVTGATDSRSVPVDRVLWLVNAGKLPLPELLGSAFRMTQGVP